MPRKRRTTKQRVDPFDDSAWRWSLPGGGELDALAHGVTRVLAHAEGFRKAIVRANKAMVESSPHAWFVADKTDMLVRPYTAKEVVKSFPVESTHVLGIGRDSKRLARAYLKATGRTTRASISTPHGSGIIAFGDEKILWHRDNAAATFPTPRVPRLM